MINIEYTLEYLEGEPGPNFYWRGAPADYLNLINDLHVLGRNNNITIVLNDFNYINIADNLRIELRSSEKGNVLFSKNNNTVLINLDYSIWEAVLAFFLSISFDRSHNYVDFDNLNLVEEANWIISSEW